MKDKYVFDSNIFINLHQRQPRDIYPSVWNKIDELMANGTIISSREVYDELTRSDDSLSEWAKSKKEYFLPSEIPIQERVRKILSEHRGLVEGGKKQNNADPFVIALAQENNSKHLRCLWGYMYELCRFCPKTEAHILILKSWE